MRQILSIFALLSLTACAGGMQARLDTVRSDAAACDYSASIAPLESAGNASKLNNLDLLLAADGLFHLNDFAGSDDLFEEFNARNIELTDGSITRELTALAAGNLANEYRPYMMDSLFVSYYQLWDALADGRSADARVIINQSYTRQQMMSREYADLIEYTQSQSASNTALADQIAAENAQWAAFRDIMNPALMYLSGIYFLTNGDFADAQTYLSRANGMVPSNSFISADLSDAEAGRRPTNTVWIFVADSFAPKLVEKRLDFPVPIGDGFSILSMAISQPVFFPSALSITGAQTVANVDALFMAEYSNYRANEALRAYASGASKLALQAAMYNSGSNAAPLLGLASNLYTMASTSAEVRTWATLPKTINVLRTANDGLIEITSGGNLVGEIELPTNGNYIIYLRGCNGGIDTKIIKLN